MSKKEGTSPFQRHLPPGEGRKKKSQAMFKKKTEKKERKQAINKREKGTKEELNLASDSWQALWPMTVQRDYSP